MLKTAKHKFLVSKAEYKCMDMVMLALRHASLSQMRRFGSCCAPTAPYLPSHTYDNRQTWSCVECWMQAMPHCNQTDLSFAYLFHWLILSLWLRSIWGKTSTFPHVTLIHQYSHVQFFFQVRALQTFFYFFLTNVLNKKCPRIYTYSV